MAELQTRQRIVDKAIVHEATTMHLPATADRNFELPAALYVITAGSYLGFLGILALGFGNPHLIIPMGIMVVLIAMAFGVPTVWMRMKPANAQRLTPWGRFRQQGIMTAYGRSSAGGAIVQVLILPVLIVLWGLAVVTIAAVVR